jgi:uncharacterized membrane protein (DUF373 family)
MSDLTTAADESEQHSDTHTQHSFTTQPHKHADPIALLSATLLEKSDSLIYAIVGVCFLLGGLFALGYSFWDFSVTMFSDPSTLTTAVVAGAIIKLVSDLLLVLIIMEVLGTVIHYLKSHATSLHPFLYIGIISATRAILSIGARLSVETVTGDEFNRSMIELGVNALAILALGITLKLLGNIAEDRP